MSSNKVKIAKLKDLISINTAENNEIMVNISKLLNECICIYKKNDMAPYLGKELWVRLTVFKKLKKVAHRLSKKFPKYRLKVVYGYRHPDVQELYFKQRICAIKKLNNINELDDNLLNELAHSTVASPKVAGHPTGGAVDLTVCYKNGKELDMGTKIADFSDSDKIKTFYPNLTPKQIYNRAILSELMKKEGFAPYYGEWWHFSYGDKEWAWFYNKKNAIYDKVILNTKSRGL